MPVSSIPDIRGLQLSRGGNKKKRGYNFVELETREKLVHICEDLGYTIKEAARVLEINYSTAKHIIKEFKR
jgi:hypothetical protein